MLAMFHTLALVLGYVPLEGGLRSVGNGWYCGSTGPGLQGIPAGSRQGCAGSGWHQALLLHTVVNARSDCMGVWPWV